VVHVAAVAKGYGAEGILLTVEILAPVGPALGEDMPLDMGMPNWVKV
jgi:hypothetical protein